MSQRLKRILIAGAAVGALVGGGAALAAAAGGVTVSEDDRAEQVSGPAAESARGIALDKVEGNVTSIERADDGASGYEIEIDAKDGKSYEVNVEGSHVTSVAIDD